ncbi:MAG: 4Fe-4S binding protein [Thermoplasmata archaeon]
MTAPGALLVLVLLAAGMVYATAYLLRLASEARTRVAAAVVLFLMGMMVAMLAGAAIYAVGPTPSNLVLGFWVAGAAMSVGVFPLFAVILTEARAAPDRGPRPIASPRGFAAAAIGLTLGNELLMGAVFSIASGTGLAGLGPGPGGVSSVLVSVVDSPWFLFSMAGEMALTAWFVRARLPPALRYLLFVQAGIMVLSPPAFAAGGWTLAAIVGASIEMIGLIIYLFEHLYRTPLLSCAFGRYALRLLALYALMMAGLFAELDYGAAQLFVVAVLLEMVLFFEAVLRPEPFGESATLAWREEPRWTTLVLSLVFVGELFMGALLDLRLDPARFRAALPANSLSGPGAVVAYHALENGFWFTALVTGSTWFLAMMGVEMGALVLFKIRESRNRENRVRMGLMLGSYAAFAVFFPSIYYSIAFPALPSGDRVPVLGWSMGIGSAPLAASVFAVLLASYLLIGLLAVLFGRRVVCSVFCTAPLMYQGTTVDSMKSFNRSSPIARKYLSSRLSRAYQLTTGTVMASLALFSVASYLDTTGALRFKLLGADPTVFLFALYFGVLWYALFITIPYAGTYSCVTMGWCYTGSIAQAFQKVGFFRLRVRDREVCRRCTTLDCAKACPIGLVDMPGHFRTRGEFVSSKCCGVGDCIEACPYGNMYIHDIRHVLARWFARRPTAPVALPMVRPRRVPPSAAAPDGAARSPGRAPVPASSHPPSRSAERGASTN